MTTVETEAAKQVLSKLPPIGELWPIFLKLVEIPRGSYNHEHIVKFIKEFSLSKGFDFSIDEAYNMLVKCPATPGMEDKPTVCLQGHWDIVNQKEDSVSLDFKTDPLVPRLVTDDKGQEWLMATGTSLGADDGIGVAMAFNAALDASVVHGPLELLITANEEVGLLGASQVAPGSLKAKYIINIDSEDVGVITISCCGAFRVLLSTPLETPSGTSLEGKTNVKMTLSGLTGGHTGVDVKKPLGNAIKLLGRIVQAGLEGMDKEAREATQLVGVLGGTAANAIARKAEMELTLPASALPSFIHCCSIEHERVRAAYTTTDPAMLLTHSSGPATPCVLSHEGLIRVLRLLELIPHGVQRMSPTVEELVETSMATSVVSIEGGALSVLCSCRSCVDSELDALYHRLTTLAHVCGFSIGAPINRYGGWPADPTSPLTHILQDAWRTAAEQHSFTPAEARIEAIHAGLECGIIVAKHPGMLAASIGPTVIQPHSTSEALLVASVPVTNTMLGLALRRLCE